MKIDKYKCDNCGFTTEAIPIGWATVDKLGRDITKFADLPLPADLCSRECINNYLDCTPVNNHRCL